MSKKIIKANRKVVFVNKTTGKQWVRFYKTVASSKRAAAGLKKNWRVKK